MTHLDDLEDQYLDWAVGDAYDRASATSMDARTRCRRPAAGMRRRWRRNRGIDIDPAGRKSFADD
jgi:hypothetical protein